MNSYSVPILLATRWGLAGLAVVVLSMMAYILGLRAVLLIRTRRYRRLCERWTPILLDDAARESALLPSVHPQDRFLLLVLWNSLREPSQKDPAVCDRMDRVAAIIGIDGLARRLLRHRSVRKRLLGIVTLGQLRDRVEWRRLCEIARSEHPLLSLAATAAIARIDPAQAAPTAVSLAVGHDEWPAAKIATILEELGPDRVSEPLARALLQAPHAHRPRIIPLLALCHYSSALQAVRQMLREPHPDEVVSPCLHIIAKFADRQDLALVYRHLTHRRWHVRAAAAVCVGRMGTRSDQQKLAPLLTDRQWWVRYRAAQAIVGLSPQDEPRLHAVLDTLTDSYARDILTQAIAEGARPGRPGTQRSRPGPARIGAAR